MNITMARYGLSYCSFRIFDSVPVERETEKCYYGNGKRFLKVEIGKVRHLSCTTYPYLEIAMVDATEEELLEKLAEWFEQQAEKIRKQ